MKKYLIPLFVFGALFATSCEQMLEIPQKGVVSIDDFYQTDEDAEGAMVAAYDVFAQYVARGDNEYIISPYNALFNLPSDDIYGAGEFYGDNDFLGEINDFRFDADAQLVTDMYRYYYKIIYAANLVIDRFKDGLPEGGPTATTKRVVAEARVMRAWAHMMLAIGWDCPPLVDHVLGAAEKPYNCNTDPDNPMSHEELLEWCATEALAAVPDLRERQSTTDKDGTTYITKGFANFVAGKAYVFANNMSAAKAPLKAVITSGKYALVPAERMRETFHITGEGNEETIFASNIVFTPSIGNGIMGKSLWMHMDISGWRTDHWGGKPNAIKGGWGAIGVRDEFAQALIANDGMDSPRRKAWIVKYDPEILYDMEYPSDAKPWWLDDKDPRYPKYADRGQYIESIVPRVNEKDEPLNKDNKVVDPDNPKDKQAIDTTFTNDKTRDFQRGIASYLYGQTEYLENKRQADPGDIDFWLTSLNVLIARYAEVLLLYAEACAATNDNDGLQYLNMIQTRAGSAHKSATLTLAEVQNEKRFEMFMEGTRFPDLVRWGMTDKLVNNGKEIPYMYDQKFAISKGEAKTPRTEKTDEHVIYIYYTGKDNAGKTVGFVKGKHEHFPYPYSKAVAINPNLTQNPGW